jgi:hypothetical protein
MSGSNGILGAAGNHRGQSIQEHNNESAEQGSEAAQHSLELITRPLTVNISFIGKLCVEKAKLVPF